MWQGARAGIGFVLALCSVVAPGSARADASVPYLPSWTARHHLERLADDAGLQLTTTQWPLPAAAVEEALDALPKALPPDLERARAAVRAELARRRGPALTLTLRTRDEAPVGFGDDYDPGSSVTARSPTFGTALGSAFGSDSAGASLRGQLGVRLEQQAGSLLRSSTQGGGPSATTWRPDDSALVANALGVNVQAFAHRTWWGAGWQNSLILGDNAPAWIGVGLQRASGLAPASPWLAWIGPWNAEFFVARAQDPLVVANQANHFLFVGWRLTVKPFSLLELGLSRTEQTAGRGNPDGWRNFLRALAGRGTNADTTGERIRDPGNEMAGFDLRLRCPLRVPCAGYTQLIGEDQAGLFPSHYLSLYGLEAWSDDGRHRWFAEYANSTCRSLPGEERLPGCAYRNYQYLQGYTNGTRWAGASIGPDSRLATLGWYDTQAERRLRLHWGYVGVSQGAYAPTLLDAPHGVLLGASVDQSFTWRGIKLTGEAAYTHLSEGHDIDFNRRRNARLGLTLEKSFD